ncbi:unnamed protein product [Amoebophrya sp. A120]|nr:unnamed protein product [Amoebophrya sp. A120]|eukprot:GSA120T00007876001.1
MSLAQRNRMQEIVPKRNIREKRNSMDLLQAPGAKEIKEQGVYLLYSQVVQQHLSRNEPAVRQRQTRGRKTLVSTFLETSRLKKNSSYISIALTFTYNWFRKMKSVLKY